MTKPTKTPSVDLRQVIREETVSLASLPMCLVATALYLSSVHNYLSSQPFNKQLFVLLVVVFFIRSLANIIDAYSVLNGTHTLDAFTFLKRLKWAKEVSAVPSLSIVRRCLYIAVIGLSLNDITLRYMVSNVGESFHALNTNNILLTGSISLLILLDLLSILAKPTPKCSAVFTSKIHLLDIAILALVSTFAVFNINNELDSKTVLNNGVEREFRTTFPIHLEYRAEELVYPTIMGSKSAAIKLLGTVTAEDIANDGNLATNLAKMLVMNIEANNKQIVEPTLLPVVVEIPNAFSRRDIDALLDLINGDTSAFKAKTFQILNDIENIDHSYAVNLYNLLSRSENIEVGNAVKESEVSTTFDFIMSGKHKIKY